MKDQEIVSQRIMIKGVIAEAGLEDSVEFYLEKLRAVSQIAKDAIDEREVAAFSLAMGLLGLEFAEELS